ncbi:secretory carrier-associated membrane protein 3 [Alosa alosa]|uniref:secretory carrier-associated membrane protein 3 n=1 Tax=Alosa alosa TaxID=278164 RepID=UPI0020154591|nr:secretory carrier-associated membrane protein 3 [Alosa alosa]
MSKYTSFPEPNAEDQNPFQDPSVTQHSSTTGYATLDLYNPFDNKTVQPPPPYEATVPNAPPPAQTPPNRTTPTEPRNYGSYTNQNEDSSASGSYVPPILQSTASPPGDTVWVCPPTLHIEAKKKNQMLALCLPCVQRNGEESPANNMWSWFGTWDLEPRQNNWPPLPSFCPVGPCFYQDISVDINQNFQRTVTIMYYYWMFTACTLLFNLISSLANFCVDVSGGVGLGLAILWFILFTPCSFVCWYRPVYKAFRSDSSFNFFAFFFVFFAQVVFYVIMTIGIPGWGFSGWIVSLATLKSSVPVGVIMLLNAILFTGQAAMGVVMLKKVHSLYRQTGASFEKAQAEFATGVMSNQAVRQAAATATTSAAQSAFTGAR